MGSCVIFCAAEFDGLAEPIGAEDHVIAADGGLLHVQGLGIVPDEIIGDFDSLGYVPEGARVHPVEKDDTDSMLAVRRGLALGFRRFLLYGGMDGTRLDHTVANFQTLGFLARAGAWAIWWAGITWPLPSKTAVCAFPPRPRGTFPSSAWAPMPGASTSGGSTMRPKT